MYSPLQSVDKHTTRFSFAPPARLKPLTLAMGLILAQPVLATDYTWGNGNFSASGVPSPLLATDTFEINAGVIYFDASLTSNATITANDTLNFYGTSLTNKGIYKAQGNVNLVNASYGGAFYNYGTFEKSAGSGVTSIGSGVGFVNYSGGVIQADTGAINFDNANTIFSGGSVFTGAGQINVTTTATFNDAFTAGNLNLIAGTFSGGGTKGAEISAIDATHNSVVNWSGGMLSGTWLVDANQTLNILPSSSQKLENASLTNNGLIVATDDLSFYGGSLTNNGVYKAQGDVNLVNASYGGNFYNYGIFEKTAGSGTTSIESGVGFTNYTGGVIKADTGVISFDSANATFNTGTVFTGQINVTTNATFLDVFTANNLNLIAGTFSGGGAKGAEISAIDASHNSVVNWSGGMLSGAWIVDKNQTLNIQNSANAKYNNATVTNNGLIAATDTLSFYGGSLTNNGSYKAQGDVSLVNAAYGGNFYNYGTFEKTAGSGTTSIESGVGFINYTGGVIQADSGVISFDSANATFNTGTVFTGQINVTTNATFLDVFTANNLNLMAGTFSGGGVKGAEISAIDASHNSVVNWSGGILSGAWIVDKNQTLNIQSSANAKYNNATVTNNGLIAATDTLSFYGGSLTNNGSYKAQGDVSLVNAAYGGNFYNYGTFEKTAGSGTTSIESGVGFINYTGGVIQADSGIISFDSANATFNTGTVFTGQINVTTNATFLDVFTANDLNLMAGTFSGGGAKGAEISAIDASHNSVVNWSGGMLTGAWLVDSKQTFNIQSSANAKYNNASVTNNGLIAATDTLSFYGGSLTNNGVYQAQGDVSLVNAGYGGNFVNNGVFAKTSGGGVTDLSSINFSNTATGDVEIQTGTVQVAGGFDNQGLINLGSGTALTIAGSGNFTSEGIVQGLGVINGNLTDAGTITPGAAGAPGALTINGNYQQNLGGVFNEQLGATTGLLGINGNASFGGSLALSALSGLQLTIGENITIAVISQNLTGVLFGGVTNYTDNWGDQYLLSAVAGAGGVTDLNLTVTSVAAVPVPGAVWLFGSGLLGLLGLRRKAAK